MPNIITTKSFRDSITQLSKSNQEKVNKTTEKIHENPSSNGLNLEKISNSYLSLRVDDNFRIILKISGNDYLLSFVGKHDLAYAWAEKYRDEVNLQLLSFAREQNPVPLLNKISSIKTNNDLPVISTPPLLEPEDIVENDFFEQVSIIAERIINCSLCNAAAGKLGIPNPGWVGRDYPNSRRVVFILQNPGLLPKAFDDKRDDQHQESILDLSKRLTGEEYKHYSDFCVQDMQGKGPQAKSWPKWTHPISKCVAEIVKPSEIAWLNVVMHRTSENIAPNRIQIEHGLTHLEEYLFVLKPTIIVAVGSTAARSLSNIGFLNRFSFKPRLLKIKHQGSSNADAELINSQIANALINSS